MSNMKIGFTGTRTGLTQAQRETLTNILIEMRPSKARHGGCRGADTEFHDVLRTEFAGGWWVEIAVHPGPQSRLEPFLDQDHVVIHDRMSNLRRNRIIVACVDLMIATPNEFNEQLRSGTWATIRYARKAEKPLIIIWPDGPKTEEQIGV